MEKKLSDFSMNAFSLKGKVAMVTGANQGLGMAYAVAFAKAGADIFIPHFTDDVSEIKGLIEETGQKVKFLQGDLTKQDYIEQVVNTCLEEYGKIDILVNNAGGSIFGEFLEYPDSAWQKLIDIDLNSVYYLSHRVVKEMVKQNSGKIINIGSALSFTADKKCPPYTASKHAVLGLTKVFANEVGQYNIQTNAICPGFLATDVNKDLRADKDFYNKITNRIPSGRWGELNDLMGTAIFLASSASDYINGWYISVDGGFQTTL
ncbi:SDR family oxidoreductase [Clostridium magnum]|uniref:2-dehydro-3-deoxy-D-gluconate 5-dehydrogenase n=1 Tax=Clostridium magnum DSM 2767 TaxID=1121326 RepID=A0A161YGP8_9CLOT|nr:SDR family oxidoreductase [Clostridium magnum]KZL89362.1 2-dehydro-3-deoxy-D-gluconate 5-dehydrogenase [Clostridium magnum DSM 2767]SHI21019.1 2-deoxy-D-gluconate 3-dehydrogenase [Clostridium magnum DSM 2767]